ncbi:MAG: GAF domain-containing protein [Telluria sp.]
MSNDAITDPILTSREVARMLGVAVSTAQIWMERGELASWKTPGGHRRARLSDVQRLIAQRGTAAPEVENEFAPLANPGYPVPDDEAARLTALAQTGLVDSATEHVFNRLTRLAAQVTDSPMALMTLLTARRQWFKSRVGLAIDETPRSWAFCTYAILGDEPLVVEDAEADTRFRHNPLVTGEPHIRFYAGFPLKDVHGFRLGTLCILDREARKLRQRELEALHELACLASEELQRR